MQRRSFLAGASGAVASLPLAAFAQQSVIGEDDAALLRSYVTSQDQFPQATPPQGDEILNLERRPNRKYDPASIAVMRSAGNQMGYLPADSTGILAVLLDEGFVAYARPLFGGTTVGSEFPVQIYLKRDHSSIG